MPNYDSTSRQPFKEGGRAGYKKGQSVLERYGKKGIYGKIGDWASRKLRGKEKTEVKGIEQDVKTGALTHKAPKDRLDTAPGRVYTRQAQRWSHGMPMPKRPKSNDMSWPKRKKQIAKQKKVAAKEKKRKADWEKKYVKKDK